MYLYRIKLPFLKITQNKVAYIANYSINRSMVHTEQLVECTLEIIVNKKQSFLSFSFLADNEPDFFSHFIVAEVRGIKTKIHTTHLFTKFNLQIYNLFKCLMCIY